MKREKIFEDAIKPLKENDVSEWLKQASSVRPERYTLWNEVNSEDINWKDVINSIVSELNVG